MTDKLKELYDALIERGLSLLPPKGQPVSCEVTEEAVMIYEALAATPLPRETSYTVKVGAMLDRESFLRAWFSVPDPAPPVLGVRGDQLVVLGAGSMSVSTDDGRFRKIEIQDGHTFAAVVRAAKTAVVEIAESIVPIQNRLLGHRDGYGLVALRDGQITVKVGSSIGILVKDGDALGAILGRVQAALSDIADPRKMREVATRPAASKSEEKRGGVPVMHFPRSAPGAWPGRIPDDRWVAGNVLGRSDANTPAVLNRGRITIETTDGHLALVDVEPSHGFDEVVRCVKLAFRLEIERLTSTGKDMLFAAMSSMAKDVCVLRRGKVTLRTSGAVETGFLVEPLESLSAVEDRIAAKLCALAGVHTPLFGCETVTGRFVTLRDGKLQLGDPTSFVEAIPVVKGASLERVLDQVKEALLKRAGGAVDRPVGSNAVGPEGERVGSNAPGERPAGSCPFYLYLPHETPVSLASGVRFVPDAPLPKGYAEVVTTGTFRPGQGIPCRWVGEGVHHPMVARWILQGASGLCAYPLPPPPRTSAAPEASKAASDLAGLAAVIRAAAGPLAPEAFDAVKVVFLAPDVEHGATFNAAQVRTILAGGDPWSEKTTRTPAPEDVIPAGSVGIIYPKIAVTETHDTAVFRMGSTLRPASYPTGRTRIPPEIRIIADGMVRAGEGLPCKTVDGSPWPSDVTLWTFHSPPPGCAVHATSSPRL